MDSRRHSVLLNYVSVPPLLVITRLCGASYVAVEHIGGYSLVAFMFVPYRPGLINRFGYESRRKPCDFPYDWHKARHDVSECCSFEPPVRDRPRTKKGIFPQFLQHFVASVMCEIGEQGSTCKSSTRTHLRSLYLSHCCIECNMRSDWRLSRVMLARLHVDLG